MEEEENPHFELEFPSSRSRINSTKSGRSVESLESSSTVGSPCSASPPTFSLTGHPRARPKSLILPGISFFRRDGRRVFSVPTSPVSPTDSASSVDDASIEKPKRKYDRSRLSLNVNFGNDNSRNVSPEPNLPESNKSNKLSLPNKLRASFSRLWTRDKQRVPEAETHNDQTEGRERSNPLETHNDQIEGRDRINPLENQGATGPRNIGSKINGASSSSAKPECKMISPSNKQYVDQILANGHPIIPFSYPTFVIIDTEKKESKRRDRGKSFSDVSIERPQIIDTLEKPMDLQKVLNLAKDELQKDKTKEKTGRDLFRRRSSSNSYVPIVCKYLKNQKNISECEFINGKSNLLRDYKKESFSKSLENVYLSMEFNQDVIGAEMDDTYLPMDFGRTENK